MAESELDALHSQRSFRVEFHIGIEKKDKFLSMRRGALGNVIQKLIFRKIKDDLLESKS